MLRSAMYLVISCLLLLGCASESDATAVDEIAPPDLQEAVQPAAQNANAPVWPDQCLGYPAYLDVVVVDDDGWEICLWKVRHRSNRQVISYNGTLAYTSGSVRYFGDAQAVYDYELDQFTVVADDTSWSGGTITYSMKFVSDGTTNEMRGPYFYRENPNRVNRIDAFLTLEGC